MVYKRLFPAPPPSWSWLSFLARCWLHLSQELPCREGRQGGAQAAGEEVWERQRGAAGRCLSAYASGTERGHSPVVHVTKQHRQHSPSRLGEVCSCLRHHPHPPAAPWPLAHWCCQVLGSARKASPSSAFPDCGCLLTRESFTSG